LRYGRGVTWRYERSGGILRTTVLLATIAVAVLTVAPASLASTAQLSFSPGVVTLGSVRVRTTTEQAVTLTNAGEKSVTLSGFSAFGFNGTFMVNPGTCSLGRTLAPGESCTFSVVASPFVVGAIRGQYCFEGFGASGSAVACGRIVGGGIPSR
jgi:Abnormal spindle-like microcephaly-assoc'd, ASPM-SPD-2-Hydin